MFGETLRNLVAEQKAALRARALVLRASLNPDISAALAAHLSLAPKTAIAAFWPLPGEPAIVPLLHTLHAAGHQILLPKTPPRGHWLTFHPWHPGAEMLPERFGTAHRSTPPATPDLILVPFLAFDRTGARLGYGGGYYDRTLADLPTVPRAGLGFAALQLPTVPTDPHDTPLPIYITDKGLIRTPP